MVRAKKRPFLPVQELQDKTRYVKANDPLAKAVNAIQKEIQWFSRIILLAIRKR
jgi:hypothetical protein